MTDVRGELSPVCRRDKIDIYLGKVGRRDWGSRGG